jgi:copper ion binding protein
MKKKINIEGMSCMHCVKHVKEALGEIQGVSQVDVNLAEKTAVIEVEEKVGDDMLKAAVEEVGYDVTGIEKL